MGYGRGYRRRSMGGRYNRKRGSWLPSKRRIFRRRGNYAQAKQISALSTAVNRLTKRTFKYSQYKTNFTANWLGTTDYHHFQYINPISWVKVFQSQADDESQIKCRVLALDFNLLIQAGTGFTNPACVSVFCVSVKNSVDRQFMVDTANGANLVENEHFTNVSTGVANDDALIILNKSIFNIHYHRRFMLGTSPFYQVAGADQLVSDIHDANRRLRWRVNYNKELKTDNAGTGDVGWKSLAENDISGNDRIFTYIFSNQPIAEEMYANMNCLIKLQTIV